MAHRLELSRELEHMLQKACKGQRSDASLNKLIVSILQDWLDDQDSEQYDKHSAKKDKSIPQPDRANLDVVRLGELKVYVDEWINQHGENAVLINNDPNNISYSLKDKME